MGMEMKLPVKMGMETMSDYGNGMGMRKKSWEWEGMGIKMLIPHTSDANVNLTLGELSAKYQQKHRWRDMGLQDRSCLVM